MSRVRWTFHSLKSDLAVLAAMAGLCLGIFFLAGGREHRVNGKTRITYWTGWTGPELKILQSLVDEYNQSHGDVFVKMTSIGGSYQKMKIAFAAGDTPDVCSSVWADDIADYALRGGLTPLDSFLASSDRGPGDYPSTVWDVYQYEGKTYALSMTISVTFVIYNKTIFREAGLDPERPPRTLEEFDRAAERCTKYRNGDPAQGFERIGFAYDSGLLYWSNAFGADLWDPAQRRLTVDTPQMAASLHWLKANADRYGYRRLQAFSSSLGNVVSPNNPFITGKVAMCIVGAWYRDVIDQYAPNDFEWGWFPLPAPEGGRPASTFLNASMFVIPKASRHKEKAWDFLLWATSPYVVSRFHQGRQPGDLAAMNTSSLQPEFQTPYWTFVRDLAQGPGASTPQFPLYSKFANELLRVESLVLGGEIEPEAALRDLQIRFQAALDEAFLAGSFKAGPSELDTLSASGLCREETDRREPLRSGISQSNRVP